MRKLFIIALTFCLLLIIAMPVNAVLLGLKGLWDRNVETDLAGYNLYRTDGVRTKINSTLIGTTFGTTANPYLFPITVPDGSEGTLRFRLTAVDTAGNESLDSIEAPYTYDYKAPAIPTGFGITKQ
jgi:hypothetical protein